MKTKTVFVLVVALALCAPAAAQAATLPVQSLSGDFAATNSTVTKTPDGVHFGTYADAGAIGGSLIYSGLNSARVSALTDFGYTFTYRQAGNTTGAAPYARVFIDGDPAVDSDGDGNAANDVDHDIILDPSLCGTTTPAQAAELIFNMATTPVRFDDDQGADCANTQMTFAAAKAAAGPTAVISSLLVSQGFSTGADVSGLVPTITVNGTTFAFNVPPAAGAAGAPGVTTILRVPTPVAGLPTGSGVLGTRASSCKGDELLTLHAARRTHLISVRATLRGKPLKVEGRAIRLDLRERTEGNYDVKIVERFRSHARVRASTTHRVRSVACA